MKEVFRRSHLTLAAALVALVFGTAGSAGAVNPKPIADGLSGAIGAALDEVNNQLYFVEYNTGALKRLELTPACLDLNTATTCTIHPVASGFSHPEDVAIDVGSGVAYVTTRDDPGTGALYRVDLGTGSKTLVTFNLGAPQQLVLRAAAGKAYTVGYNDGRLRQIDLATGVKTPLATGLDHPVGITVTGDDRFAYVTEQGGTNAISMVDLALGVKSAPISGGLTAPFFLAWADGIESSVYMAARNPLNQITKIDLATGDQFPVFTGLPFHPSAAVVNATETKLFITTDSKIMIGEIGLDPTAHPDLMGIGLISISEIDSNGYANSFNGYYKNAPFGGTLSIFANLSNFWTMGARYYKLSVSKNSGPVEAITRNWGTRKWDPTPPKPAYKPFTVTPISGTDKYEIPSEYGATNAAWWYPPFLIMKYPTAENGVYEIFLDIYVSTASASMGTYSVLIKVDNSKPIVNIHNIYQHNLCGTTPCPVEVIPCDIVQHDPADPLNRFTTSNEFTFKITAKDAEGHLRLYRLYGMFGDNDHIDIVQDTYNAHVGAGPPYVPLLWHGVDRATTAPKTLTCNCAYTFYLYAWSRTTDGYGYLHRDYVDYHKSFTLNQPSLARCVSP